MARPALVTSISGLIEQNVKYLKGELQSGYSCGGPVAYETSLILPHLIQLNERGLITTNSQPAWSSAIERRLKRCYVSKHRQRASVDGLIHNSCIGRLLQGLQQDTKYRDQFIIYIGNDHDRRIIFGTTLQRIAITTMDGEDCTFMGFHDFGEGWSHQEDVLNSFGPYGVNYQTVTTLFRDYCTICICDRQYGRENLLWDFLSEYVKPHQYE